MTELTVADYQGHDSDGRVESREWVHLVLKLGDGQKGFRVPYGSIPPRAKRTVPRVGEQLLSEHEVEWFLNRWGRTLEHPRLSWPSE